MATTPAPPALKRLVVKAVNSGDQIVLRDLPVGGPPPERTLLFSNITAPKLGRTVRANQADAVTTKDEPYAWEAREFLRSRMIGAEVKFQVDASPSPGRDYGVAYIGDDNENVSELLVAEGLAKVRDGGRQSEERTRLLELQEKARLSKKGVWDEENAYKHVRNVKEVTENLSQFVDKFGGKPIKAIIEYVRDGSTVRACLLPDFYSVSIQITGIRCPPIKYLKEMKVDPDTPDLDLATEAKFLVERNLLQRDVDIILDSASNNGFYGTIIHPKGDIAEVLLKGGFAQCVDWSMGSLKPKDAERLREAEKFAKEKRLKRWKGYQPQQPTLTGKEKEFQGTVVEIVNGDALMIKAGSGPARKYFLSSVRPPRDVPKTTEDGKTELAKGRPTKPLYDIPWLFEAREFLRKKLIGKKVSVIVDYKQPASENFPEKTCCTVKIGGVNVAEALVSKGLATAVRHGQNDDARSSCYDALKAADEQARKAGKGLHGKQAVQHRVTDVSADAARARTFLSSLQRIGRVEAVVEFVTSGSRLRLYIPKETCLATFLLAGISCPRGSRIVPAGTQPTPAEPFGDEALQFTREKCMQREVEIKVDGIDKAGNFIGWLWVEGTNLSVALVEEGLASVHFSAEKSEHYRALKLGEDAAKASKTKIWTNYVEEEKVEEKAEDDVGPERKVDYQSVVVTDASKDLTFFAQVVDQGPKLEALMTQIRQEFQTNPPLPGAYTPKKGDLCAAKFQDDEWYRARVEKVQGGRVSVFYVDYGNREVTVPVRCASLPAAFTTDKPYANEFHLAFVKHSSDTEYQEEAFKAFQDDIQERTLLLNVEYKIEKQVFATLTCPETKNDVGKGLVADGYLMVEFRREKRFQKMLTEYRTARDEAKKQHKVIWQYGDITEDDAKEFGR